jgi:hypothetical protein
MSRAGLLLRVLLASSFAAACSGVTDPEGESPAPVPLAGAGGAAGESTSMAAVATPSVSAAAGGADDGAVLAGSEPSGGASGQGSLPAATFCDAPAKVFVPSCGNGSCHSIPGADMGDFAVDTKRAYNFVDKVSFRHAECGRIIDSQDYSKSLLLLKIQEGAFDTSECGGIMPVPSFPRLGASQIACVASWLQQFQR